MENIIIKQIKYNDIPEYYEKFIELVNSEFTYYSEELRKFLYQDIRSITADTLKELLDVHSIVLGAYKENKIIGLLIAHKQYSGVSLCIWVMLDPNYQGQGIGSSLLKEWEKVSLDQGAHSLRLETTAHNIAFYTKNGFRVLGIDPKGYCGIDKYIMKKLIAQPTTENMIKNP